jgi:enamine deaminase RidA (YjgF/YER057c/UK114 family)
MRHLCHCSAAALVLLLALNTSVPAGQKKKDQDPKSQVQPLPPEPPKALMADTASLDFHISPILHAGHLSAQIRQSLGDLIKDTHGETIVKLRAFVAGSGDARTVKTEVGQIFGERRLPLPVLTILQVGALPQPTAQVVIEAVVATGRQLNSHGLVFAAGQSGQTLADSLQKLQGAMSAAAVDGANVLSCTCYAAQLPDFAQARAAVTALFPNAVSNIVEALRDPVSETTTCEAVGRRSQDGGPGPLVLLEHARAAVVQSPRLVFTGLQLSFGNYLDDASEAVARLNSAAAALDPVESPVQVNAFSYDLATGAAIRKRIKVPASVLTVQAIEGLPGIDSTGGIEAILAAGVSSAQTSQ